MTADRTRVLVVEDDPRTAGEYVHWIPDHWSTSVVESGEVALSAVDPGTDVVVVSGEPPDVSAYRVLDRLASRGYECQTVLVAAGGSGPDFDGHGSDEVLPASVGEDAFRATLERLADRAAYDEQLQEYYSLVSRKAVLEARLSPDELAESEEYDRLAERTADLNDRLDALLGEISETDDYGGVFRDFFPGTTAGE